MSDFTIEVPKNEPTITIRRSFAAPRDLVWDTWTKPEHIKNWWGMDGASLTVCEVELKVGGKWRYVFADENGKDSDHAFSGIYETVDAPETLSNSYIYEPMPFAAATVTLTLEEKDGRTYFTEVTRHQSIEHRDGHVASGMEEGARQTFDRLERLLPTLS